MLIDWVVVAAYLIGVTVLGISAARRVKTSSNFFISDRQSGKLLMTFFSFDNKTQKSFVLLKITTTTSGGGAN